MKKKQTQVDSKLFVRSTASIRKEVIDELTMPDKSLALLLNSKEPNDDQNELTGDSRNGKTS